jgi:hypothetical protein
MIMKGKVCIAGGAIRNPLIGRPVRDIDIWVDALSMPEFNPFSLQDNMVFTDRNNPMDYIAFRRLDNDYDYPDSEHAQGILAVYRGEYRGYLLDIVMCSPSSDGRTFIQKVISTFDSSLSSFAYGWDGTQTPILTCTRAGYYNWMGDRDVVTSPKQYRFSKLSRLYQNGVTLLQPTKCKALQKSRIAKRYRKDTSTPISQGPIIDLRTGTWDRRHFVRIYGNMRMETNGYTQYNNTESVRARHPATTHSFTSIDWAELRSYDTSIYSPF